MVTSIILWTVCICLILFFIFVADWRFLVPRGYYVQKETGVIFKDIGYASGGIESSPINGKVLESTQNGQLYFFTYNQLNKYFKTK